MTFPRRATLDLMTNEERRIFDLIQDIEGLGCHELLTDVSVKLTEAQDKLADFIDLPD